MTSPQATNDTTYVRFVATSSAASGVVFGAAAGSLAVLVQSSLPLVFLGAYLAVRLFAVARSLPRLVRLWRWWSMPLAAVVSATLASFVSQAAAPVVLGASVAGFIVWIVAYAIFDVRFDPRGEHGAGWL